MKVWTKYDIYNVVNEFNRIESEIENYYNKLKSLGYKISGDITITAKDIKEVNDLKGTSWVLNDTLNFNGVVDGTDLISSEYQEYEPYSISSILNWGEQTINLYSMNLESFRIEVDNQYVTLYTMVYIEAADFVGATVLAQLNKTTNTFSWGPHFKQYGTTGIKKLTFSKDYNLEQTYNFLSWLKANATFEEIVTPGLDVKTNWTKIDIPDVKDIIRIKNNINKLQEALGRSERLSTDIPNSINFNYIKANEIEQRLNEITTTIDSFDFQYYNCGNAICGSNLKIGGVL